MHVDMAPVIGDDAIGNRKSQAGALPIAPPGKEWFEQVFEHFVGHAAAVIGKQHFGLIPALA